MNDEKLIDLVKSQPAIYDKTNVFYSNKHHVKDVWKEVAVEMNQTVPVCQKRWRYLRDYFVRQLHMTQNDLESSSLGVLTSRKRSFWPLFEKMCFLKPFSSTRKSRCSDNLRMKRDTDQGSVLSVSSSNSLGEFNSFDYMTMYQTQYAAEIQQAQAQYQSELRQQSPDAPQEPVCKENPSPPKKRKKSEVLEELLTILKKPEQIECDEHEHFFKSLLNNVRRIDDEHIMAFRSEVLQLIMKYRCISQKDKILDQNGSNADVVIIDTGERNWRKNLNCF